MLRSKIVEKALKVKLPPDYRRFLDEQGYLTINGYEIFGITEEMQDITAIPSVIGATELYREDYELITEDEIVISYDPVNNNPITLNCKDGKVYLVNFANKKLVAQNFEEFLRKLENNLL